MKQCTIARSRKCGSGRLRTSRTAADIRDVIGLVLSQEGAPQTHLTLRQIARKTGIHRSSVVHIIQDDLRKVLSLGCEKKTHAGAFRGKLYQPFAIKLT